jgi:hypothetical protein
MSNISIPLKAYINTLIVDDIELKVSKNIFKTAVLN